MRDPLAYADSDVQTVTPTDEPSPFMRHSYPQTYSYPTTPPTTSGRQLAGLQQQQQQQQQTTYATTPRFHSRSTFESPLSNGHPQQPSSQRLASAHRDYESKHLTSLVYILNCTHCNAFFTDRGMKAVLLLNNKISLYSTDAPPVSVGPLWSASRSGHGAPQSLIHTMTGEDRVTRTCSCLTETLGCFGCGAIVGYHIVTPCACCTESINRNERSANGHRYVFHQTEVSERERLYFKGDNGVKAEYVKPERSRNRRKENSSQSSVATPVTTSTPASSAPSRWSSSFLSGLLRSPFGFSVTDIDQNSTADQETVCDGDIDFGTDKNGAHSPENDPQEFGHRNSSRRTPRKLAEGDTIFWSMLVDGLERPRPLNPDLCVKSPTPTPGR